MFVWFGLLKPLGLSAAEPLVLATTSWMPLLEPQAWLAVIGWWEVAIGVTFLSRSTLRIAVALLFLQMVGAFMPLVILSDVTFQPGGIPYAPTMEGQYIIKNLVIIAAALVLGGTVRGRTRLARPDPGADTTPRPCATTRPDKATRKRPSVAARQGRAGRRPRPRIDRHGVSASTRRV